MKIKGTILLVFISFVFINCSNNKQFLVKKGSVGKLTKSTKIKALDKIFKNDSIVKNLSEGDLSNEQNFFRQDNDEYIIYSKEGKKLLEITPVEQHDSTSTIKSIQIFDTKYITEKGVSLASTFKDVHNNYQINRVESTLTSATLFVDELNATISIDKKELGLSGFSDKKVSIDQIPDFAKIKYFIVWFN